MGAKGRDVEGRGGGDAVFCVMVARPTEGRETRTVFCACFLRAILRARVGSKQVFEIFYAVLTVTLQLP
jgi:hypothetical protein